MEDAYTKENQVELKKLLQVDKKNWYGEDYKALNIIRKEISNESQI